MRWDKRRLKRPQRCGDYRRAASQLGYSLLTQDPCYWDSRLEVLVWADLGGGTLPSVSSLYPSGQAAARVAATRPARRRFRTGARVGVRALGDRCAAGVTVGQRMMPLTVTWTDLGVRIVCTLIAGALIGYNRGEHGKAAGLRTTILVCLAASVAMLAEQFYADAIASLA